MRNVLTVMRKEFARFFGDKRLVLGTLLLPGLLIFVLYTIMGTAFSDTGSEVRSVAVVNPSAAFSAYAEIPREASAMPVQTVRPPAYLQSLSSSYVTSEAVALHYAGACGIWEDFLEEEGLTPTVSGRMGSGKFEFRINTTGGERCLDVCNAQLEIDAAWEGRGSLALIEAKMDLSEDFHIRQLYYPFRLWSNRVTKPVRSIFFNYSDGSVRNAEAKYAIESYINNILSGIIEKVKANNNTEDW